MKRLSILFIVVQFYSPLCGQTITSSVLKKADQEYAEFSYTNAVTYYKLALKKDENEKYVTGQIAMAYRNLNEPDSAELWFKRAIDNGEMHPDFYFYLAEALLSNQKYPEARYWYAEYSARVASDSRSGQKLAALENLDQFFSNIDQIKLEPLTQNSKGLDFSPAFYNGGIMFVSSRPRSAWVNLEFNWDASNFLDYYFISGPDQLAMFYEGGLSTKFHEGPLVFYNDQQSVVYTRNNLNRKKLKKDNQGVTNLKLFFAQWDEQAEQWVNEKPFVYNDDSYSISSPAISEDGTVLIFASDMPGGHGASDLYISHKGSQGWSVPKNLGLKVNSEGRDGFPFIYENQLYFSSEGRGGIGGLDLYCIGFDGNELGTRATNLGVPFNSNRDDFGLIRNADGGYFSSNRGENQKDNIYKFDYQELAYTIVVGEVYDRESNTPINESDVFFKNSEGQYLYTRSMENGNFLVSAPVNSIWTVAAGKFDFDLVEHVETNISGSDTLFLPRLYLKRRNIPIAQKDSVEIPVYEPVVDNRKKPYNETSHFVDQFQIGDTLRNEIVYFDLDSHALRSIANTKLDDLVNFIIEHVDVEIVLNSHTDSRSSETYNRLLSERRSRAVTHYLIEKGVDVNRISSSHFGESNLINDCEDDVACSEEQHQLNRRTTVYLIKREAADSL